LDNKDFNESMEQIDAILKQEGISRRDAMKILGLGGATMMMGSGAATPAKASSKATGKIVIVGGGLSGIATAAKLNRALKNPDITIIEPNPQSTSYQPGYTLVGSGLWTKDDITYETEKFIPSGVTWIQDKVVEFDPKSNKVKTSKGQTISYDYMVVATGLVLDFGAIKGLEEVGDVFSADSNDGARARKILGKDGLCSIYFGDGAVDTWTQMQEFVSKASSGSKVKAVFPEPHTPFKCGGAQKKIVNLTNRRLHDAKARENATLDFFTNRGKLFSVPEYHEAIKEQMKTRGVNTHFSHKFVEIDRANKLVIFEKHWQEKGEWDEDLKEYMMVTKTEKVEAPYDFCHIIPPQKAPDVVASSPIGSDKGWVPVNKETLQHVKYPNIFAVGDVIGVPLGKSGGSARKQYAVVVENLISLMEGKELKAKYNGYTVCPVITDIGKVMLAEFKWGPDGQPPVTAPSFPLDPTKERWLMWLLKAYMLKPMTQYGMLSGRA